MDKIASNEMSAHRWRLSDTYVLSAQLPPHFDEGSLAQGIEQVELLAALSGLSPRELPSVNKGHRHFPRTFVPASVKPSDARTSWQDAEVVALR